MANHSVAVLPLASRTAGEDESWLGQGIADEMIHALSWVAGLRVAPLALSMRFPADAAEPAAVGERLGAESLLLGEFRRDDETIELAVRLVRAQSGEVLWKARYVEKFARIHDIQDDILKHLVNALGLKAPDIGQLSVKTGSTHDMQAYDDYLRGLNYFFRYAEKNLRLALEMFGSAVDGDPAFARAWARLAECHAKYFMYYDAAGRQHCERALVAGKRAVELAPAFARAHTALGTAELINRNFQAAEKAFERAVELNPRQFDAYYQHARTCFQQGNLKRAAELFEQAVRFQPDDYQAPLLLRQVYLSLGRVDEARTTAQRGLALAQRHLELNSKDARAIYLACGSMIQLGMYQAAMEWSERALAIDPDDPMINYNVACCYAQAGEPEKALDCLDKAKGSGMLSAGWLKNDSDLFSLHDHPRFQALLAGLQTA
ncbi:MAG TPA: tetratricopeptide repeat protein [Gammaproteobacteria bacterium]